MQNLWPLLTDCTTTNPYTGETQISRTMGGTGLGAGIGALTGLFVGGSSRAQRNAVLIGTGMGALAGSAIGHYMDKQETDLRTQLRESGVSVVRHGNKIILNMPSNITFNMNQDSVKSRFYNQLDSVAQVLSNYNRSLVDVIGYTDSTGHLTYNKSLSERRAGSVAQYLISRGVDRWRISVMGFGSQYPVASNTTEQGRALNRRVEIQISPFTAGNINKD